MTRSLAVALAGALAAALAALAAWAAPALSIRLAGPPPAAAVGRSWSAIVVVRPSSAGRPAVTAQRGVSRRAARVTQTGRGRYRVRLAFPSAGTWTLAARLGGRRYRLGAVIVRARPSIPPPPLADVTEPFGVALAAGGVLVADRAAHRIVLVDPVTAQATVVAGSGSPGHAGDGGPATQAAVGEPIDVEVGPGGDVYVVHGMWVRRVDADTGTITTVAGTGERAHSGDGGPARLAALNAPDSVDLDAEGNLYVAEYESRVRRIDALTGIITTVVGDGVEGSSGDGGPAAQARISHPHGLAVGPDGTIVVADTWNHRIRRVDGRTGIVTTLAGTGEEGFFGDGGPALAARFNDPIDVELGAEGSVYVADGGNHSVRRIAPDGVIRRVAGTGSAGVAGDGRLGPSALLSLPNGVAVAADGTVYVAEFQSRRVRRIDGRTGRVSTIAR